MSGLAEITTAVAIGNFPRRPIRRWATRNDRRTGLAGKLLLTSWTPSAYGRATQLIIR